MPKVLERMTQREYAKYLDISNEAVSRAVRDGRIKKGWDKKEEKILVEHANKEFGFLHKDNLPGVGVDVDDDEADDEEITGDTSALNSRSSYMEAKRVKEVMQARLAELDLKERQGELVRKDEVYKHLFAYGQTLRISILAIPDRIIDNLLAAKSRAEAHGILQVELHKALEDMTTKEFDFTPRN